MRSTSAIAHEAELRSADSGGSHADPGSSGGELPSRLLARKAHPKWKLTSGEHGLRRYKRGGFAVFAAASMLSFAVPATAQSESEAATLKARADSAMEQGRFDEALSGYRSAYRASPGPALLYNMGRAEERLGRYPEAHRHLEQFARSASPELKAKVPALNELMAEIRAHLAFLKVYTTSSGATVYVRGAPVGTTPMRTPLGTAPGRAVVRITQAGYRPYERTLSLEAGEITNLDVSLERDGEGTLTSAAAAPGTNEAASPSTATPVTKQWWFWTGVGVVVIGGTILAVALLSEKDPPRGDIAPGQIGAPLVRF